VPAAALNSRKVWRRELERHKYVAKKIKNGTINISEKSFDFVPFAPTTSLSWNAGSDWLRKETVTYGKWSKDVNDMILVKSIIRHSTGSRVSLSDWARTNRPGMFRAMQKLRRLGHMTEVLDYMGGNINLGENQINNDVKNLYTRYCIRSLKPTLRGNDILLYYSHQRENLVFEFSQNLVYQYCYSSM